MPQEPELHGLLALMLLHHSRRVTRSDASGDIVTLEYQDRAQWDRGEIAAGLEALAQAARLGRDGPYQLQAAIAALHASAPDFASTDWRSIARLYDRLEILAPSPVVALNRAVAIAMNRGAEAGLAEIDRVAEEGTLAEYPPLHGARADLLRRVGRLDEAAAAYETALGFRRQRIGTAVLRKTLPRAARDPAVTGKDAMNDAKRLAAALNVLAKGPQFSVAKVRGAARQEPAVNWPATKTLNADFNPDVDGFESFVMNDGSVCAWMAGQFRYAAQAGS